MFKVTFPFHSLQYSVFSSHVNTSHITSNDWILDSGATDHMVHSLQFFTSITSTVQILVQLPNGAVAKVTHIGTVHLSSGLILENVLCIPTFSFNLVSISKLTQSSSCCCIFLSHFCLIQDLQLWRMIGLGKKQGGLYTLQPTSSTILPQSILDIISKLSPFSSGVFVQTCNAASVMNNSSLWHCRLGHPSAQRLALLHSFVPDAIQCSNKSTFDCNICPLAKQRRLPFPTSIHTSSSCFELVHVDI